MNCSSLAKRGAGQTVEKRGRERERYRAPSGYFLDHVAQRQNDAIHEFCFFVERKGAGFWPVECLRGGGIFADGYNEPGCGGEGVPRAAKGRVVRSGRVGGLWRDGTGDSIRDTALDGGFEVCGAVPVLIVDAGAMSAVGGSECARGFGDGLPVEDVETIDGHLQGGVRPEHRRHGRRQSRCFA